MELAELNTRGKNRFPGLLGIEILDQNGGDLSSRMQIKEEFLAPNGYLHAAVVVALADTTCGYGAVCNLPAGAHGFTTVELKSNFLGTTRKGAISCRAHMLHSGKSTQVWDATVTDEASGKTIALFRCTQMILYK